MKRVLCIGLSLLVLSFLPAWGGEKTEKTSQWNPSLRAVSDLEGKEVTNLQGEDLGEVQDVIVDMNEGAAAYIILEAGGVLDLGDEEFIVPFAAFRQMKEGDTLVLKADKELLLEAPEESIRTVVDRDRARTLHLFYGISPYWEAKPFIKEQIREKQGR